MLSERRREQFDRLLDQIVADLPDHLRRLLEEVPLIVDDEPSDELLDDLGMHDGRTLCGLHSGIPLTERSVMDHGVLPPEMRMFRGPIMRMSSSRRELERQIRITLLHEMGHHFGLDEDDLERLGYG